MVKNEVERMLTVKFHEFGGAGNKITPAGLAST